MVKIEGYEIFAELQRGAWVTLFKAFDLQEHRTVLIKLVNDQHAPRTVQEQLLAESELSPRLLHPNLRRVYASGKLSERAYLILEYVEGPTLAELLLRRLPLEFCAWIAKQIAQALSAVHREGILHRDVKPRNIFISWEGEVKLGDLGLAVNFDDVSSTLAGTPAYLAPEIVLGQKVSESSDLFSLGAVLYEMLTTAPPFADHTTSATLHRIANLEPTPVAKLRPEVPAELAALCRMLLSKAPEARCRSAEEVVDILTQFEHAYQLSTSAQSLATFLEAPETYAPHTFAPPPRPQAALLDAPPPPRKPQWKRNVRRLLALAVSAVSLVGLVLANIGNDKPQRETILREQSTPVSTATTPKKSAELTSPASEAPAQISALNPAKETLIPVEHAKNKLASEPDVTNERPSGTTPAQLETSTRAEETLPGPNLLLLSEPRANVFAENTFLGVTPLRWTLPQRDQVYELRFISPQLPEVRTLVTATILDSDTLRLNLWQEVAFLEVTVNPWGEIWLDGKPIDTTPLSAPLILKPGLHELAVRHPQLGTRSLRIVLSKGDTLRKTFDFFTQ